MSRHTTSNRVNGVFNFHTFIFENFFKFVTNVLSLRYCQSVTWNDYHFLAVFHQDSSVG